MPPSMRRRHAVTKVAVAYDDGYRAYGNALDKGHSRVAPNYLWEYGPDGMMTPDSKAQCQEWYRGWDAAASDAADLVLHGPEASRTALRSKGMPPVNAAQRRTATSENPFAKKDGPPSKGSEVDPEADPADPADPGAEANPLGGSGIDETTTVPVVCHSCGQVGEIALTDLATVVDGNEVTCLDCGGKDIDVADAEDMADIPATTAEDNPHAEVPGDSTVPPADPNARVEGDVEGDDKDDPDAADPIDDPGADADAKDQGDKADADPKSPPPPGKAKGDDDSSDDDSKDDDPKAKKKNPFAKGSGRSLWRSGSFRGAGAPAITLTAAHGGTVVLHGHQSGAPVQFLAPTTCVTIDDDGNVGGSVIVPTGTYTLIEYDPADYSVGLHGNYAHVEYGSQQVQVNLDEDGYWEEPDYGDQFPDGTNSIAKRAGVSSPSEWVFTGDTDKDLATLQSLYSYCVKRFGDPGGFLRSKVNNVVRAARGEGGGLAGSVLDHAWEIVGEVDGMEEAAFNWDAYGKPTIAVVAAKRTAAEGGTDICSKCKLRIHKVDGKWTHVETSVNGWCSTLSDIVPAGLAAMVMNASRKTGRYQSDSVNIFDDGGGSFSVTGNLPLIDYGNQPTNEDVTNDVLATFDGVTQDSEAGQFWLYMDSYDLARTVAHFISSKYSDLLGVGVPVNDTATQQSLFASRRASFGDDPPMDTLHDVDVTQALRCSSCFAEWSRTLAPGADPAIPPCPTCGAETVSAAGATNTMPTRPGATARRRQADRYQVQDATCRLCGQDIHIATDGYWLDGGDGLVCPSGDEANPYHRPDYWVLDDIGSLASRRQAGEMDSFKSWDGAAFWYVTRSESLGPYDTADEARRYGPEGTFGPDNEPVDGWVVQSPNPPAPGSGRTARHRVAVDDWDAVMNGTYSIPWPEIRQRAAMSLTLDYENRGDYESGISSSDINHTAYAEMKSVGEGGEPFPDFAPGGWGYNDYQRVLDRQYGGISASRRQAIRGGHLPTSSDAQRWDGYGDVCRFCDADIFFSRDWNAWVSENDSPMEGDFTCPARNTARRHADWAGYCTGSGSHGSGTCPVCGQVVGDHGGFLNSHRTDNPAWQMTAARRQAIVAQGVNYQVFWNVAEGHYFEGYKMGDLLVQGYGGDTPIGGGEDQVLEAIFAKHNRDDRPDGQMGPSLSKGDVVQMAGKWYAVASMGFDPIGAPSNITTKPWRQVMDEQDGQRTSRRGRRGLRGLIRRRAGNQCAAPDCILPKNHGGGHSDGGPAQDLVHERPDENFLNDGWADKEATLIRAIRATNPGMPVAEVRRIARKAQAKARRTAADGGRVDGLWAYIDDKGMSWGPFTTEERREMDGVRTERANYTWQPYDDSPAYYLNEGRDLWTARSRTAEWNVDGPPVAQSGPPQSWPHPAGFGGEQTLMARDPSPRHTWYEGGVGDMVRIVATGDVVQIVGLDDKGAFLVQVPPRPGHETFGSFVRAVHPSEIEAA